MKIATFVIIDLKTTGLPHLEYNRTKVTEICLLAAFRNDIRNTIKGEVPPIAKLTFHLNPERKISSAAVKTTGINSDRVKYAQTFKEKFNTINSFLQDLRKPVCLVAHNGNNFDYKLLLAECADTNFSLPNDLLCVDSLAIFRKISKGKKSGHVIDKGITRAPKNKADKSLNSIKTAGNTREPENKANNINSLNFSESANNSSLSEIMTDDEDEWPDLNLTPEELQDIDKLCIMSSPQKKTLQAPRESFKLSEIYRRYFGEVDLNAHRAEDDCLMLLRCMVSAQDQDDLDFLKVADRECKLLKEVKALERK